MYPSFAPEDFPAVYAASQNALKSATKAAHDSPDSQVTLPVYGWLLSQRHLCNRHDFPRTCKGVQSDASKTCDQRMSASGDAKGLVNMLCAIILAHRDRRHAVGNDAVSMVSLPEACSGLIL